MTWRRAVVVGMASVAALLGAPALTSTAWAASSGTSGKYIVTDTTSSDSSAAYNQVGAVGGPVLEQLSPADSVVSTLDSSQVSALSTVPGVTITPDVTVSVEGSFGDSGSGTSGSGTSGSGTSGSGTSGSAGSTSGTQPSAVFPEQSGATKLWAGGDTGTGVNVAVLDTGIDPLPDFTGRLVGGVDLSGGTSPFSDGYGHGTFVAGLIAGDGASSNGQYTGEAPGAGLVSVKVAGANGATDLATVIAGVDWTIAEQQALHIGVLNISLGYEPVGSTAVNPLDIAVERAWHAGIVVVASAGNYGPFNGTITSPGDDPLVITAGALNDLGQTNPADDTMTDFSSVGPTEPDGWFKPDLVASGRSVVSLAAPGSTVYEQHPSALIGKANFVGSGTSFSAAITSGAVALLLQADPGLSPNDVKAQLLASTFPGPVGNPFVDGHGDLNVYGAVTDGPPGSLQLSQPTSSGSGPLGGGLLGGLLGGLTSPGGVGGVGGSVSLDSTWSLSSWNPANWSLVTSTDPANGEAWNGEAWNGSAWNVEAWNGEAWNGSAWNVEAWNGEAWNGQAWNGAAWNGSAWNGSAWNGSAWNGSAWNGEAWNGSAWNGSAWNGEAWNGEAWNGAAWNGAAWNGAAWNGEAWNGEAWNGAAWNGQAWN